MIRLLIRSVADKGDEGAQARTIKGLSDKFRTNHEAVSRWSTIPECNSTALMRKVRGRARLQAMVPAKQEVPETRLMKRQNNFKRTARRLPPEKRGSVCT